MNILKKCIKRLLGIPTYTEEERSAQLIAEIRAGGGVVGENVDILGSSIDLGEPYLIRIGSNVTITGVTLLTHDASTKKSLGYTKAGKVHIGDNVFVGYGSILLPNTTIGSNVIIGAGTVVARDIPDNVVVAGSPCRVLCSYGDYLAKNQALLQEKPVIDLYPAALMEDEEQKNKLIESGFGYIL